MAGSLIPIIVLIFVVIIFVSVILSLTWVKEMLRPPTAIISPPPPTEPTTPATVLKLWDTGARHGEDPQVGLLLEIHPGDGAAYRVQTQCIISLLQLGQLQPGQTVSVHIDPQEPTRITVALSR